MVAAGDISKNDTVVEIGPGRGVLTEALLERAGRVLAIEKDAGLAEFLREKFATEIESKKLVLICGDALAFDPSQISAKLIEVSPLSIERGGTSINSIKYKVVANIPYYITGLLFRRFWKMYRVRACRAYGAKRDRGTHRGARRQRKHSLHKREGVRHAALSAKSPRPLFLASAESGFGDPRHHGHCIAIQK